ncbi:hypothetical protein G7Y89_g4613 [Cudoniella acicularis]|uniref:O-methyltransferase C-terminal domain-containing protein n=1 Tax=Cudoniella acicularis TaxID=354080 RepID=A0A8H4W4T2_9HELO|nr:hypothetical protein G7Y89_g4613 [Cudoniella acicularis]
MDTSSASELATIISVNTAKITEYLTSRGLAAPSFHVDAPNRSLIPSDAPEIETARSAVIDATLQLRDLLLGPKEYLMSFTHDWLLSMQAIVRFQIATSIPIHGEKSFTEIAESCSLDELDVRRILRHAMTKRIFYEPRKGIVAHTAASRLLVEDSQMSDWVGASTDELWQAASQTVNAMVKYPGSQEPNETGFAIANNSDKSVFEVLSQDMFRAKRFGNAMKAFTEGTGFDLQYVDNYPWKEIENGTVVDVGGSHGFACTKLASSFPGLKFIVQDLPSVVANGANSVPAELSRRIEFMAHDFLKEQPIKNADVYFFRWIFHNWSDKYCIQILRNLIPALKNGACIVINDNVLLKPGTLPNWREERLRSMDLTMLELQNSRERELEDWEKLFAAADKSRLEWKHIKGIGLAYITILLSRFLQIISRIYYI